jgi:hypothetical protein
MAERRTLSYETPASRRPGAPARPPSSSIGKFIIGAVPAVLGLGLIALGLWIASNGGRGLIFIVGGMILLATWAFSGGKKGDYSF